MKKFIEKLKSINLTLPMMAVIVGLVVVITYLMNYYGVINVAGLKQQNQQETKTEEPAKTEETKEEPKTETPAPATTPTPTPVPAAINLSGSAYASGVKLTWSTTSVDTSKGFKIVKSTSTNPVYPGSSAVYVNGSTKSYAWEIKDGKTYYFRVCQYTGAACGVYSNNAAVKAPYVVTETPKTNSVTSINLYPVALLSSLKNLSDNILATSTPTGSQYKVGWTVNGYSASGFKLVWSKNPAPTYPNRSGDKYNYYSEPSTSQGVINAFDGPGTYYVRVCEYLGGACGVYSNQITVILP